MNETWTERVWLLALAALAVLVLMLSEAGLLPADAWDLLVGILLGGGVAKGADAFRGRGDRRADYPPDDEYSTGIK
jgi:hypothetical protein